MQTPNNLINFFIFFHLASLQINSPNSNVDILLGQNVQLRWELTTAAGETYVSANIKLKSSGQPSSETDVALFTSEFVIATFDPYTGRGWTATRLTGTKDVNLNIKGAKTEDDGVYTLELQYTTSRGPISQKYGITLNVLGKLYIYCIL